MGELVQNQSDNRRRSGQIMEIMRKKSRLKKLHGPSCLAPLSTCKQKPVFVMTCANLVNLNQLF